MKFIFIKNNFLWSHIFLIKHWKRSTPRIGEHADLLNRKVQIASDWSSKWPNKKDEEAVTQIQCKACKSHCCRHWMRTNVRLQNLSQGKWHYNCWKESKRETIPSGHVAKQTLFILKCSDLQLGLQCDWADPKKEGGRYHACPGGALRRASLRS